MIPRYAALPGRTPRRPIVRSMADELLIARAADGATSPPMRPRIASPAAQPVITGRPSRTARPAGPWSRPVCGLGVSRTGSTPAPVSRRPATNTAAAARAAVNAAMGRNITGAGLATGWRFSAQPSGLSQRSQCRPGVESATTRISSAAPKIAAAMPLAWRRVAASWAASTPTPANMTAPVTTAVARNSALPAEMPILAGDPAATVAAAVITHSSASPAASPASAWATARRRVVCPARSSSRRPASSSPRVSRVAASMAHTAPTGTRTPMARHAVNPPMVASCWPCPSSAEKPAFVPKVSAIFSRDATVG